MKKETRISSKSTQPLSLLPESILISILNTFDMLNTFLAHWTQRLTTVKIFLVRTGQPRVEFWTIGGIQLKVIHRLNSGWQCLSPMENPFTDGFALKLCRPHSKFLQKWTLARRGKRELNLISWKHCQRNWDPDDCLDQPRNRSAARFQPCAHFNGRW